MTSYIVTLYKLFLLNRDSTTGHFQRGYTVHSIDMLIFPRGTALNIGNGYYTRYSLTGFTEYNVDEGDVALDAFGKYYQILSVKPWTSGEELAFNECEVEEIPHFPFLTGMFGYDPETYDESCYVHGYFAL